MTADEAYAAKKKQQEEQAIKDSKFYHGDGNAPKSLKKVRNQRLKGRLEHTEELARFSTVSAMNASDVLLPSAGGALQGEGMSSTWQFRQADILANVNIGAKKKLFNISGLEYGPYCLDYTLNGRHLLVGGRKGHITLFDAHKFNLNTELNVNETIRDVQFLHDQTMFAVAQKQYVHIYDNTGMELHVLRHHDEPTHLQFLPYHYLMVSGSKTGMIRYQDTSTGSIVAENRTFKGEVKCMRQNRTNAIMHVGHNNGSVTLWSPNMTKALVTMQCHASSMLSLAVDPSGRYMATSGVDGKVRTWDIRMYKQLHEYFTVRPSTTMDISQSGMLALGYGPHVQVWKDAFATKQKSPYLYEPYNGDIVQSLKFHPYEDYLGVGLQDRILNMIVPGAGEANFDTFEYNPFEVKKQRQERTVRSLLEKLQPEMITLDKRAFSVMSEENESVVREENTKAAKKKLIHVIDTERHRAKGRNKTSKKLMRSKKTAADEAVALRKEAIERREDEKKAEAARRAKDRASGVMRSALDRFT